MRTALALLFLVAFTASGLAAPPHPWSDVADDAAIDVRLDKPHARGSWIAFDVLIVNRGSRPVTILKPIPACEQRGQPVFCQITAEGPAVPKRDPVLEERPRALFPSDFVTIRPGDSLRLSDIDGRPFLFPQPTVAGDWHFTLEYDANSESARSTDPDVARLLRRAIGFRRKTTFSLGLRALPAEVAEGDPRLRGQVEAFQKAVALLAMEIRLSRCNSNRLDRENAHRAVFHQLTEFEPTDLSLRVPEPQR